MKCIEKLYSTLKEARSVCETQMPLHTMAKITDVENSTKVLFLAMIICNMEALIFIISKL